MKDCLGFIAISPSGHVAKQSFSYLAKDARWYAAEWFRRSHQRPNWRRMYRAGWRIKKVRVIAA